VKNNNVQPLPVDTKGKLIPDVKGMGLKDALYVLETAGVKVKVNGKGRINNQSIAAGTPVAKGQEITLSLN
jgi:cell division protein FtsI (penicillin-binding protein 3)